MNKSLTNEDVLSIVANKLVDFEDFAKRFAESRFLVASSEYGSNNEEVKALEKIAAGIVCNFSFDANSMSLDIDYDNGDRGNYLEVIQGGLEAPLTGGSNGIVTNPDGSTRPSAVPEALWGNPIEEYEKTGSDLLGEISAMLTDIFREHIQNAIRESSSEIADLAKQEIADSLSQFYRGE